MAKFLVRIHMHGGDIDDYSDLLTELDSRGFSHTISDVSGVTYRLPWGDFACEMSRSPEEVLDQANACVSTLGFKAEIVVVEYSVAAMSGLSHFRHGRTQK